MKTTKAFLLLAACSFALTFSPVEAKPKVQTLKTFNPPDRTISSELTVAEDKTWLANSQKAQTVRLFEVAEPKVEACLLTYRAKLKTEGLTEPAYLEMWCRFPGKGEFFSRGLDNVVTGSNDWASFETPFFLKKGEMPDLVKLNLIIKGTGKVWIKDVELLKAPLPGELAPGKSKP
jgi:hypothetical protein